MCENKCVCYFKNGVCPYEIEWFNEKLTNQSHSFSDCILKIIYFCIRLIISVGNLKYLQFFQGQIFCQGHVKVK